MALDIATFATRWQARPRALALLDVREAGEAERGHIPGATALPRRLIEFRIASLVPDRATPVVVYDGDDGRAALARQTLLDAGYHAVEVLEGGAPAWAAAGHALATGFNVPSKAFGEQVLVHDGVAFITPDALAELRAGQPALCVWDVRTPGEFERASLPGAVNMPGFETVLRAHAAAQAQGTLLVHCAGRTRSIIAARTLQLLGFPATALENGTMGWTLAGHPLAPGTRRDLPEPDAATRADARQRAEALALGAGVEARNARDLIARRAHTPGPSYFFDVRPADAFAQGHAAGAVHVPSGQLIQCTDDYIAVEAAEIVLMDDGDARAAIAAYWLRRMGFPRVSLLVGGLPAWIEAAGPVETGRQRARPLGLTEARRDVRALPREALEALDLPQVFIDVGTSADFAAGHLPGAQWLPRGWLEARIGRASRPGHALVLTARDERQAIFAAATLLKSGTDEPVFVLDGGNAGWCAAGGTLETGPCAEADFGQDVVTPPYAKGTQEMRRYLEWEKRLHGDAA
ncbi:rhodanese-like domain-containing protein [Xanthobacter sp. DSM 24535]|uniref:rhodanese-like domain-containing protein n=1 Tax=Roseixanthobacter psychrophilus TaxID=3119917 RepID=UPI003729F419